jgi:hypothetical protein
MVFYLASQKDAALIEIGTKNEIKKINHKGHKDLKRREARKIKFLRSLRLKLLLPPLLFSPASEIVSQSAKAR